MSREGEYGQGLHRDVAYSAEGLDAADAYDADEASRFGEGCRSQEDKRPENEYLLDLREQRRQVRMHYYVKIAVSTFLCALLLIIGVPVFMESRVTGSLAYTALGVVLVGFGLVLAAAVVALLFHPPFNKDGTAK